MNILVIDPSGSFEEGKGITGWCLFKDKDLIAVGQIRAEDAPTKYDYWQNHINLIESIKPDLVVIEDFRLYADKAMNQINSRMETPKLIAIIEYHLHKLNIPYHFQMAYEVKNRWEDRILLHKGYITQSTGGRYYAVGSQVSEHIRDAIRHGVHYVTFKLKQEECYE